MMPLAENISKRFPIWDGRKGMAITILISYLRSLVQDTPEPSLLVLTR